MKQKLSCAIDERARKDRLEIIDLIVYHGHMC